MPRENRQADARAQRYRDLIERGMTYRQIAELEGVTRSAISAVMKRWRRRNGIKYQPRKKKKGKPEPPPVNGFLSGRVSFDNSRGTPEKMRVALERRGLELVDLGKKRGYYVIWPAGRRRWFPSLAVINYALFGGPVPQLPPAKNDYSTPTWAHRRGHVPDELPRHIERDIAEHFNADIIEDAHGKPMSSVRYLREGVDGCLMVWFFAGQFGGRWMEGVLYEGDEIEKIEWRKRK